MPAADSCEVLVVGLGPVGQLLTLLLGQAGVEVVGIDRGAGPHGLPRAAATDDEVLRIFQSVGLAAEVLADAAPQDGVSFVTAAGRVVGALITTGGRLGHPPLVSLHQPSLERTLLRAMAERGLDARWGTELLALEQDAGGVTARLGNGGELRARYVVGCDGASSAVRRLLGIPFAGSTFTQRWLVVDTLVDRPLSRVPHPYFVGHAERAIVTLPMGPGRHRWEWMLHPGEDEAAFLDPAAIGRRIAPWLDGEQAELERAVIYTYHSRSAGRWRDGRVLLAGDAAHVMPPFAGQGFSSGARDAANLAWKLAAVLRGAPEGLLSTYEAERRPHVAAMQGLAERWGGFVQTSVPWQARTRDRLLGAFDGSAPHRFLRTHAKPLPTYRAGAFAVRPRRIPARRHVASLFPQPTVGTGADTMLLDDALPAGWVVIAAETAPPVSGVPVVRLGADLLDVTGELAGWLAAHKATWVLLRPDRFVFACGGVAELAPALAELRAQLGPAAPS